MRCSPLRQLPRLLMLAAVLLAFTAAARASLVYYMLAVPDARARVLSSDAEALSTELFSSGPDKLYLDKAWHGVHWLLSGSAGTNSQRLSHLIMGGRDLPVQLPYGKPRMHTAQEVQEFARLLDALTDADLAARFDPAAMDSAQIYPEDWVEDKDEALSYLLDNLRELRAFVRAAARSNLAIISAWS